MAGLIGGLVGGLAGGSQAVDQVATQQIDLNNKQQLAEFTSGLEADRNAQAQRLAQSIGRENAAFQASPTGLAQSAAVKTGDIRSTALANADPDVLRANAKVEGSKPQKLTPGEQVTQVDPDTGQPSIIGQNKRITGAEAYEYGYRTSAGAASAAARNRTFDLKDAHQGLSEVEGGVEKLYKDPATQTAPPEIASFATGQYQKYLRQEGGNPIDARVSAMQDTAQLYQNAKVLLKSQKYGDQLKGDMGAAIALAQQLSTAPAGAKPPPAPSAPDAAAPAKRGLVSSAMATQPIVGGPRDPEDLRDPDLDVPRTQAEEDVAKTGAPSIDDNAAKAARDKFTAAERERLQRRGSSATGL